MGKYKKSKLKPQVNLDKYSKDVIDGIKLLQQNFVRFQKNNFPVIQDKINSILNMKVTSPHLYGREKELKVIHQFIQSIVPLKSKKRLKKNQQIPQQKKILIIEGLPGTMKTFCVKKAINLLKQKLLEKQNQLKIIQVNTNKLLSPKDIYVEILNQIRKQTYKINKFYKSEYKRLQEYFQGKGKDAYKINEKVKKILVIDSVKELDFFTQQIYQDLLFRWPQMETSNLYVIFICSELNLQKKLPSEYENKVMQNKLTFEALDQEEKNKVLRQILENFQIPFPRQVIEVMIEEFSQNKIPLKECFSYIKKMFQGRQRRKSESFQKRVQIQSSRDNNDRVFSINEEITYNMDPFTLQQVLNVIRSQRVKQLKNWDSLVDDFVSFPQCYKIVLLCMIDYFRIQNPSKYPKMRFTALYKVLRNDHIKGQRQLWQILYDLDSMKLIDIIHHSKQILQLVQIQNQYGRINERKLQRRSIDIQTIKLNMRVDEMIKIHKISLQDVTINLQFNYDCLNQEEDQERYLNQEEDDQYQQSQQRVKQNYEDQYSHDQVCKQKVYNVNNEIHIKIQHNNKQSL